jgi:allophanate hydrolase subunit 1
MSDQDLRKVTELLREVESEEREKVMEAAEQNLLDSLKSVENITKAIDQLVIKETKRRHDFKDLLTTIKSIVVKSKKETIDGIVEIEKSGNRPSFLVIAEKLAVQLSEIEYIISHQSLEQMEKLMKIVTSEDYEEAREKIDLRFTK